MEIRFILPLLLGASVFAQPGAFTPTGNMNTPRIGGTATLLPNGKVLIAGGASVCYFGAPCQPTNSAELYDPEKAAFTPAGRMSTAVTSDAVLLPDGRVLIAGYDSTQTKASLELYDPSSGTFTAAG